MGQAQHHLQRPQLLTGGEPVRVGTRERDALADRSEVAGATQVLGLRGVVRGEPMVAATSPARVTFAAAAASSAASELQVH